ncbi:MAG: hypothetical protein FJY65_01195 [Calditrichaeota bacterium]|nr:hypothetical protein [Calditrichota bacterium]
MNGEGLPNRQTIEVEARRQENIRLAKIRAIVDRAGIGLSLGILTAEGARALIKETRRQVLELAPGEDDKFDLIYTSRLRRIARQFGGLSENDLNEFS